MLNVLREAKGSPADFLDARGYEQFKKIYGDSLKRIDNNFYLNTNYYATPIVEKIYKWLEVCGLNASVLKIYYVKEKDISSKEASYATPVTPASQTTRNDDDFARDNAQIDASRKYSPNGIRSDTLPAKPVSHRSWHEYPSRFFKALGAYFEQFDEGEEFSGELLYRINTGTSVKRTRPTRVIFEDGETHYFNSWTDLYVWLVKSLYRKFPERLQNVLQEAKDRGGPFDFLDASGCKKYKETYGISPRRIDYDFYLNTNYYATPMVEKMYQWLKVCGYNASTLKIYYVKKNSQSGNYNVKKNNQNNEGSSAESCCLFIVLWLFLFILSFF